MTKITSILWPLWLAIIFAVAPARAVETSAPGRPVITASLAGHGSVAIVFKPAADGVAVTEYKVSCGAPFRATQSASGSASPIRVTNLDYGGAYQCAVTASNSIGTSPPSAWQAATVLAEASLSGVTAITAGDAHTCALTLEGTVLCWGDNTDKQLGIAAGFSATPVVIAGLTGSITALVAGERHTCALNSDGGVMCWGGIASKDGSRAKVATPIMALESGATAIAAGASHTCILTTKRGVKCWGDNRFGQLGSDDQLAFLAQPGEVTGLTGADADSAVAAIAAGGKTTCALTVTGVVKCWGTLGDGFPTGQSWRASEVLRGASAITVASDHVCALDAIGVLKCRGVNWSDDKSIFNGTGVQMSAGAQGYHCAVSTMGKVACWTTQGGNDWDWIGGVAAFDQDGTAAVSVATGTAHACVLTAIGVVKCWGKRESGRLGDNTSGQQLTPVEVAGLNDRVLDITAGYASSCAITANGGVKCWGTGMLGDNFDSRVAKTAVDVVGLDGRAIKVKALASSASGATLISSLGFYPTTTGGGAHTCALTEADGVMCWSDDKSGELGDSTEPIEITPFTPPDAFRKPSLRPVKVLGLPAFGDDAVASIAVGSAHSCALTTKGVVKCWGDNSMGQIADVHYVQPSPTRVEGLGDGVLAIAAGDFYTCALTAKGVAMCWGSLFTSFFDPGGRAQYRGWVRERVRSPQVVENLADPTRGERVLAISAGSAGACALLAQGKVKCWGATAPGERETTLLPAVEIALLDDALAGETITAIFSGGGHHCARTSHGRVKCWGRNAFGQLGDGTSTDSAQPLEVWNLGVGNLAVTVGDSHSCAVTKDGVAKCWGDKSLGQLGNGQSTVALLPVTVAASAPPQSGWWWNPLEGGRGFFIEQRENRLFIGGYLYQDSGRATWLVAGPATLQGNRLVARLLTYQGGQTLAGAYSAPTPRDVGEIGITFLGGANAIVTWPGGTLPLERYNILRGADRVEAPSATQAAQQIAGAPETGWWWSPSEGGRGFSLEVQNGTMFMAGYMYESDGNPVWYASGPSRMSDAMSYDGIWQQYGNGQTMNGPYVTPIVAKPNVGAVSIKFDSPTQGVMTLPDGRKLVIVRYQF